MNKTPIKPTMLDRVVNYFSPEHGLKRMQSRIHQTSLEAGGYVAASSNRRSMRSINKRSSSSDLEDLPSIPKLRAISKELYRSGSLSRAAVDTMRFNVIGPGLTLQSQIDREFLGLSDEEAKQWEKNTEFEFRLWAESVNADAEHTSDFYELQTIAFLSMLLGGDVFALTPYIGRKDSPYSLAIQLIEADRVCNPNNKMDQLTLAGGIETDSFGAPKYYHITKHHPEGLSKKKEWVKVPAFSENGRKNVIHVFEKIRPGQRRGVPILSPVLETLKQLTDYTNAELTAAIVSGLFSVFIKTEAGEIEDPLGDDEAVSTLANDEIKLEPGMVAGLAPGESIETFNPNRPNTAYEPFTQAITKEFGAALNIPFEVLIKHYSSSYSASRGAILEAWKMFRTRRTDFSRKFPQVCYEAWLFEAVLIGRVAAPGFIEDPAIRKAYSGASWNGPVQGLLNPVQETKAAALKCENGFSNRTKEAAEMNGSDFDKNLERAKSEIQGMKEAGLAPEKEEDNE